MNTYNCPMFGYVLASQIREMDSINELTMDDKLPNSVFHACIDLWDKQFEAMSQIMDIEWIMEHVMAPSW